MQKSGRASKPYVENLALDCPSRQGRERVIKRFLGCRKGNMAVVFGVGLIPILGAVGLAVDYARAVNAKSLVQAEGDSLALSGVQQGKDGNVAHLVAHFRHATAERWGHGYWLDNLAIDTQWINDADFQVHVTARVPTTILGALPGYGDFVDIATLSVARIAEPRWVYKEPAVADLDPEASDYNRIYVYCFDKDKKNDPETKGRTQMRAMADNAGTNYAEFAMPQCESGENLSYRLVNVRNARLQPHLWDRQTGVERYEFHTDTVYDQGLPQYDLGGYQILETVLCRNLNECRPVSQGGVIPEGVNRTPQRANQPCASGKYMYYGWEDRPPGLGWTDRDYDDIRVIVECPVMEQVGERSVRLIR